MPLSSSTLNSTIAALGELNTFADVHSTKIKKPVGQPGYNTVDEIPVANFEIQPDDGFGAFIQVLRVLIPNWFSQNHSDNFISTENCNNVPINSDSHISLKNFNHLAESEKNNVTDYSPDGVEGNYSKEVCFERCTEGLTNSLIKCRNKLTGEIVLLRIYGADTKIFIDREAELETFLMLHFHDLAPPIYGRFKNGIIYGYVPGRSLSLDELAIPSIGRLIASKLAAWHSIPAADVPSACKRVCIFSKIRRLISDIPTSVFSNPNCKYSLNDLLRMIDELENDLAISKYDKVFCHSDLLYANMVYQVDKHCISPLFRSSCQSNNDELTRINSREELNGYIIADNQTNGDTECNSFLSQHDFHTNLDNYPAVEFIDYEYGGWNYRAYDIANHFCEWTGFECDFSLYPTREVRVSWLCHYQRELLYRSDENGYKIDEKDIENAAKLLCDEVDAFSRLPHLYWGIWSLLQFSLSRINFDFMTYSMRRLSRVLP